MTSVAVCLTSHNELTKRGEAVLRRALDSLSAAMDHLARHGPAADVYVACCDDASSDATPDWVESYFRGRDWFKLVRNQTNQYIGFSRNVAAAQFDTDLVCLLDADDEYREDHLAVCVRAMGEVRDAAGRPLLVASTRADFSAPVHPEWVVRLSATIPITKVIRRAAWEFVEGMPAAAVYRETGCDDQFLIQKLQTFFPVFWAERVTAKYWNYPGSFFDRQLAKFQEPPRPGMDAHLPHELLELHRLRQRWEAAFLEYLRGKLQQPRWERFREYTRPEGEPRPE